MSADVIGFPNRRTERERHQTSIAIGLIWERIKQVVKAIPSLEESELPHANPAELQALAVELGAVVKRIESALAKH